MDFLKSRQNPMDEDMELLSKQKLWTYIKIILCQNLFPAVKSEANQGPYAIKTIENFSF